MEATKLFDTKYTSTSPPNHKTLPLVQLQVPGIYKIRHIGQTTLSFTAVRFSL